MQSLPLYKPLHRIQTLQQRISLLTTDEGFNLPVPLAAKAHQCAEKLHKPDAITFTVTLIKTFKGCYCSKSKSVQRENVGKVLPAMLVR